MTAPPFVLLVDDIPDHVHAYAIAVRARGMAIAIAETAESALAIAGDRPPACVVIDERLSDIGGWELCARIKREPGLAAVPIIVLAQDVSDHTAARGRSVGCHAWLARPATPEELAKTVEDVLAAGREGPATNEEGLLGHTACAACGSPHVRGGVRVGPVQYYSCTHCGFRWRTEARGVATA